MTNVERGQLYDRRREIQYIEKNIQKNLSNVGGTIHALWMRAGRRGGVLEDRDRALIYKLDEFRRALLREIGALESERIYIEGKLKPKAKAKTA